MYQKILLAFDGSPDGREALAQAENLVSACGATVHLLAIIDPSENMLIVDGISFIPDNQAFVIQSVLDEGVKRLTRETCDAVQIARSTVELTMSRKTANRVHDDQERRDQ